MKTYKKTFKTILFSAIALIPFLNSGLALAQTSGDPITTHRLYQYEYQCADLIRSGCDCKVWKKMNDDFITIRTIKGEFETAVVSTEQIAKAPRTSPPGGGGSCFDQALNNINSAAAKIKALLAIIGGGVGGLDFSALTDQLMGQLTNALVGKACSEINGLVGGITSPINNALGGINGAINNAGGVIGGQVGNSIGGSLGNTVGSTVGSAINGTINRQPPPPTPRTPPTPRSPFGG